MARRDITVTVSTPGRDVGKRFHILEMPADQGEWWAYRVLLLFSRGGIDVPPGLFEQGFAGLAILMPYVLVVGLQGLQHVQPQELKPLLDEMIPCIRFVPPGVNDPDAYQSLLSGVEGQAEEVATRAWLRQKTLELHLGFSVADALSKFWQRTTPPDPLPPSAS